MRYEMSSYFEDPEFKELVEKYEEMVNNHFPCYFEADDLVNIAEYYVETERYKDADKVIEFALKLHPSNTDAMIFRARSLAIKGKLEEAYRVANQIEDPTDREVKFLKADLLMEENRTKEADEIFTQLAEAEDYEPETILDILQAYTDANQMKYAEKWYRYLSTHYDVMEVSKEEESFRDTLCDYFMTFNKPGQAIPFLRMTLDENPYSTPHWNNLGKCFLQLQNFEEAHEAFDFALAIDETNKETLALKAFCYRQSGDLKEASKYYLRLAKASENRVRSFLALVKVYLDMRDYDSAKEYMDLLLKNKSELTNYELAELYCDIALCHAASGQSEEGDEYISKAIELNDHDPEIRLSTGRFFLLKGKDGDKATKEECLKNALRQFDDALLFTPEEEQYDILFGIASAYFDTQNFENAVQYFEQMVDRFPQDSKGMYFFMIYCYFYTQQLSPFMHYLAKIEKELPQLYADMGEGYIQVPDKQFNELLREIKDNIRNGEIDLNKYL